MVIYAAVALTVTVAVFFGYLGWGHRRLLRSIERGDLPARVATSAAPPEFEQRVDALSVLGFERDQQDVELDLAGDVQRLALLRRGDGAMAEVSQRATGDGAVKVTVFSVLQPGSGILATQDVYGFRTLATEVKQVFHHADPAELVREHERALGWLASQGLAPRVPRRGETFEVYVWWLRRSAADHPRSFVLLLRLTVAELRDRVFDDAGSIIDAPGTQAKVAAIRATTDDPLWDAEP